MRCPECGGPWDGSIHNYIHQPGCAMGRYESAPFPPCGGGQPGITGWLCPKCGSGVSPWQSTCPLCGPATGTSTGTPKPPPAEPEDGG